MEPFSDGVKMEKMVDEKAIQKLADHIAKAFQPEKIILFGSWAYGKPDMSSDIDLLVVMPFEGLGAHKALEIIREVRPQLPVDLIVKTPEDICQRLALNDFFLKEIMEKGKVLYESAYA